MNGMISTSSGNLNIENLNMAPSRNRVRFPMKNRVMFHSYVKLRRTYIFPWFSHGFFGGGTSGSTPASLQEDSDKSSAHVVSFAEF